MTRRDMLIVGAALARRTPARRQSSIWEFRDAPEPKRGLLVTMSASVRFGFSFGASDPRTDGAAIPEQPVVTPVAQR
jgi:hypothetical protein